jgi:hypothetical protein
MAQYQFSPPVVLLAVDTVVVTCHRRRTGRWISCGGGDDTHESS